VREHGGKEEDQEEGHEEEEGHQEEGGEEEKGHQEESNQEEKGHENLYTAYTTSTESALVFMIRWFDTGGTETYIQAANNEKMTPAEKMHVIINGTHYIGGLKYLHYGTVAKFDINSMRKNYLNDLLSKSNSISIQLVYPGGRSRNFDISADGLRHVSFLMMKSLVDAENK